MTLLVRDLSISFGGVAAVAKMNLDVGDREMIGLIGPNGAGKTALHHRGESVAQRFCNVDGSRGSGAPRRGRHTGGRVFRHESGVGLGARPVAARRME